MYFWRSLGGNLASFQSAEISNKVATGQQLGSRTTHLWIGLNILNAANGYQWSDGSPVNFLAWDDTQPDNYQNFEQCTELRWYNQLWNDISCYVERPWICKIPKGVDPSVKPIVINEIFPGISF